MLKQGLMSEFLHEAENTRKLLKAIPDSALDYRPQPQLWSVAQLASHIADIYSWFDGTFNYDTFDLATMNRPATDLSKPENIVAAFEKNFEKAKNVLENWDESTYLNEWKLVNGDQVLIGPSPKIGMVRGFLFQSHVPPPWRTCGASTGDQKQSSWTLRSDLRGKSSRIKLKYLHKNPHFNRCGFLFSLKIYLKNLFLPLNKKIWF